MALTKTALSAAAGADDLKLRVASAAGATPNCLVQVGDEFSVCTAVDGNVVSVRSRGSQGTRAKPHAVLAPVTFGLGADFPDVPPGATAVGMSDWDVRELAAEANFDVTTIKSNTEIVITKATPLAAFVLGAPSNGVDGVELRFLSSNAQAHVITLTPAIGGKVSATFAAGGASITFRAQNGAWTIIASGGVTLA